MGVKPAFKRIDIQKSLKERYEKKLFQIYLRGLIVVGEKAVNYARSLNTYTDQTGNLRSSTGYILYYNGKEVYKNYKQVKNGVSGVSEGVKHASKDIPSTGFALVVVAGMNYAMAVQARGYDVLDGAEIEAEKAMERMLTSIKTQIDRFAA